MARAQRVNLLNLQKFQLSLQQFQQLIKSRQRDVYRNFSFALYESLSVGSAGGGTGGRVNPHTGSPGTPIDTGFAVNSWWVAIGSPSGSPPPAESRAVKDYGALARGQATPELLRAEPAFRVYFINNCHYIVPLEYGHSPQAPKGFIRLTTTGAQNLVNAVVANVVAAGAAR